MHSLIYMYTYMYHTALFTDMVTMVFTAWYIIKPSRTQCVEMENSCYVACYSGMHGIVQDTDHDCVMC